MSSDIDRLCLKLARNSVSSLELGVSVVDLGKLKLEKKQNGTLALIANREILILNSLKTKLSIYEMVELVIKSGTQDKYVIIGEPELEMLETMSRLRRMRTNNIKKVAKGTEDCWTSRHSWHSSDEAITRCLKLEGKCSGSCPNIGWGDPRCYGLSKINPNAMTNHLTGNFEHLNPGNLDKYTYNYRIITQDGVSLVLSSMEPFSDHELQLASCEINKMVLDPLKEEDIVMKDGGVKYYTHLPSTGSVIKHMAKFDCVGKIDAALDKRGLHEVVIKERLAGIEPPKPMQLLQEYPVKGSTSSFDHEFSPHVREAWMADCNANFGDNYDYSALEKVCAKVVPIVKYPELPMETEPAHIDGDRFFVTYDPDSGTVSSVRPKRHKYAADQSAKRIRIGGDTLISNLVTKSKDSVKGKYTLSGNRRLYIEKKGKFMVPILYSVLLACCLLPLHEAAFVCGDDKHGTLWTLPKVEDCKLSEEAGQKLSATVYSKEYSYNMTISRCYRTIRTDKTTYGFFGPKSHLGFKLDQQPLSVEECRSIKNTKMYHSEKLTKVSDLKWSTGRIPDIKYTWCCTDIFTETVNIYYEDVTARVHLVNGYAVILSGDADVAHCAYNAGNCSSLTTTYVWEPKNINCDIKEIGKTEFVVLGDGHLMSYDMQLSLLTKEKEVYCGVEYTGTEQGLLLREFTRGKRDVDAAEKNFVMKASNRYAKQLFDNLYLSWCRLDRLVEAYLRDMSRANPSRYARAYFNKEDIAAKFVGGGLLIWECKQVEIISQMRGHKYNDVCYDMMPVKYEYDREEKIGFLDVNTLEILPVSSSHVCNSVSGYLVYDNGWRKYRNDTYYEIVETTQTIPSNAASMPVHELSFVNSHLHSVYGPSGSRYRESLVNDLAALGAKHFVDTNVECNTIFDTRITGMMHDVKEGIARAFYMPFKVIGWSLLLCLIVYFFVKYSCHRLMGQKIKNGYNRVRFIKSKDDVVIED